MGRISVTTALGAAGTITLNRVRVIANGSAVVWDTRGRHLQTLAKYETGSFPSDGQGASSTTPTYGFYIPFGRFARDEDVILPAKLFKSLQMTVDVTTSQASANYILDVINEEYVSNDPVQSKRMKKVSIVASFTATANGQVRTRLPLGNLLRAIYVHYSDIRCIGGTTAGELGQAQPIRLLVNNGAEVPFASRANQIRDMAVMTYRFDDGLIPRAADQGATPAADLNETLKIDFDVLENLVNLIDSSKANEIAVETTGNATVDGTALVEFLTEEIVAIA
jgi:hypothetical protein